VSSNVTTAYRYMVQALASISPPVIPSWQLADADDIEQMGRHLAQVLQVLRAYLHAALGDLASQCSPRPDFQSEYTQFSNCIYDIGGALAEAAQRAARRSEEDSDE